MKYNSGGSLVPSVQDSTPPPATGAAPGQAEIGAILSRLGKLKDLSQIDGVVPVFGLLLTTPLIISQNQPRDRVQLPRWRHHGQQGDHRGCGSVSPSSGRVSRACAQCVVSLAE